MSTTTGPRSRMPDAEIAAAGGFLPSPHTKLVDPTFTEWLDVQS
ncbi:hypothetical protein [Amycolatopsis sp. EV170708-02-1]|nr:hypothetical protein [Amycolatopsis sp. EV170708-02-1]